MDNHKKEMTKMKKQKQRAIYNNILNEEGPEYKDYNQYTPEIKAWEVKEYEDNFKEKVYHDVQFDKQGGGEDAYSMKFYKGKSGVEAIWSGSILLPGENKIKWKFSLQNPPVIEANIQMDEDNSEIIKKLYNFYKIWKDEWSKMLTIPEKEEEMPVGDEMGIGTPEPEGMGANIGEPGESEPALALQEHMIMRKRDSKIGKLNNKTKIRESANEIIKNHGDRMRKLAGLK